MLHWLCWLAAKLVYRLRVRGHEHIPTTGGGLIVCNHVSYIDGILLLAASRRHVRFLIDSHFVSRGLVGWVLRRIGAVPMPRGGPKAMREALKTVSQLLQDGNLIGIFPEGHPTRCGTMLPFRRGFETVVKMAGVPVIPACIDRMWGSVFSYSGGNLYWKRSTRGSGPVQIHFGPVLPTDVSAYQARSAVQKLLADAACERAYTINPPHRQFVRMAARHPFRPCFIDANDPKKMLTYGKALVAAVCLSNLLRRQLGEVAIVGIWLPSSTGGALANLAACLLGKTAVNLNYTAGPSVVQSAVAQCKIRHVLTSKRFLTKVPCEPGSDVELICLEDFLPKIGRFAKASTFVKILLLPGWLLEINLGLRSHRASDLATVVFSSGSTGEPKGVMLTHGNVASNVDAFCEHALFSKTDRVLGLLPFFHSFGYTVTLWGPLAVGASAVYLPDPRAAKEVGETCRKNSCTLMASTATFLRFYLRRCEPDDFRTMRLIVCGAEKLPVSLADEFTDKFGVRPFEGYGCTELSPVVSVNMHDVSIAELKQVRNKPGTIGHPLPGVACKIVQPETNQPLDEGVDGLLLVNGPNVMRGYLHRDELTHKAMRDGWYVTGDIGRIDADGFVTLTGRLSRFAKIGGEMVPLERLEEEIHAVLGTTDRMVAVTSVPDEKRGERIVVLHVALPDGWTVNRVCDELSNHGLPNLWLPSPRDFRVIEQIPVLGTGKLDLQALKAMASA